jgi:glutamate dehydrogenase (NAD(P)+)
MALRSSRSRARNPADRRPHCDSDHLGLWQCVGSHAALGLVSEGVKMIGIGDHTAAPYDPTGFEIQAAIEHVAKQRVLKSRADQATIDAVELLTRRCDILVACVVERVIDAEVAAKLQCPVIAEGANGPTTPRTRPTKRSDFRYPRHSVQRRRCDRQLLRGVQGLQQYFWTKDEVMGRLEHVLNRSWSQIVARAKKDGVSTALRQPCSVSNARLKANELGPVPVGTRTSRTVLPDMR